MQGLSQHHTVRDLASISRFIRRLICMPRKLSMPSRSAPHMLCTYLICYVQIDCIRQQL